MAEHIIEVGQQKYRGKIQQHLSKFVDINMPIWMISSGAFQKIKFAKFADKIKGYNLTTLILSSNQYPIIIKEIGAPSFQYLLVLSLSNNGIETVEQLIHFNAPYLQALYLDKNLLTNLRSLRKFLDRSLKILDLSMNQLVDISHIVDFGCYHIRQLSMYRNQNVTVFEPFIKARLTPQLLNLTKMGFNSPHAKKEFIDLTLRCHSTDIPKTKI